jgi:tetratricopeptide (TPR) repeat protein
VWDKAVAYCRQAGDKAVARSAGREAVACFERALVAVAHLPEGRARHEQAIDVRFGLRHALGQWLENDRILTYLREAEGLAQALGDLHRLGWGAAYMTACLEATGDLQRAVEAGQRALVLAGTLRDVALQVVTRLFLGQVYYSLGDYPQAIDLLRQNVVALDGALLREHFSLPGLPSVRSRTMLSRCLAEVGAFSEGLTHGEESLRIADAVHHPISLIGACYLIGLFTSTKATCTRRSRGSNAAWRSAGSGTFRSCCPSPPRPWAMRMSWLDGCPTPCRCWSRVSRRRPWRT